MQSISNLQYKPLGTSGDLLALQVLVAATDTNWTIQNQGTATGDADAHNFDPKWLLIDNIANNGIVVVTMGIFTITVPPYQREPIPIPPGTKSFVFNLTVGSVNAYFSATKLADVQGNFLSIQSTAVKTLIYAFVIYNVNPTSQVTGDLNASTLFNPTVADMAYNLLPMATPVGNGWMQFIFNNGSKNVSLVPSGVTTITYAGAVYTAGSPLALAPGAWGYLESDGANWYFSGFDGNGYVTRGKTVLITVGYTVAPANLGNIASFTLNPALGNYQYGTNHAAAIWTAPATDCAIDVLVTNDATAGSITFSGFTVGANVGDPLTTVNSARFIISIRRINGVSTYVIKALQ